MMWLKIFLVLYLTTGSLVKAQNSCGIAGESTPFILYGSDSKQGSWPWIAAIFKARSNSFICGGTLITTNVVITAAHCVHPKSNTERTQVLHPTEVVVKLGKHDLSLENEIGSVPKYPIDIIVHPGWKTLGEKYDSDIAIIIFESKVEITSKIAPICLWSGNSEPNVEKGTVVGWGKSESGTSHENTPKELEVSIRSNEECFLRDPRFAAISSTNTFCAGKDGLSGPCTGDSGSGLFVRSGFSTNSRWYLKGVVSVGFSRNGNCDVSMDTVFTNVLKFLTWINQVTADNGIHLTPPEPVLSTYVQSITVQPMSLNVPVDTIFSKIDSLFSCSKYDGVASCWHRDEGRRDRLCDQPGCQRKEKFNYDFPFFGGICYCCKC